LTSDSEPRRPTKKVLVLGDGTGAFLSVVRSLGRASLQVQVGWCSETSPAVRSRYVRKVHPLPRPVGSNDWLRPLVRVLEQERFDLVIATGEQGIRPLQAQSGTLAPLAEFNFLPERTFSIVYDKQQSTQLAASLGVKVPGTRVVSSVAELIAAGEAWKYPLVVKPFSSYDDADLTARREVQKLLDRAAAEGADDLFEGGESVVVQEHFWGSGVGVEVLCDGGRVVFAFQHQRVHQPRHGGASSYRRSTDLHPDLLAAAQRIVADLSYTGVMMIEFLYDHAVDDWRFVEINARFWGSLPLALAAGADFPRFYYELLVEGRREFNVDYRRDVYCRNFIGDLKWQIENLPGLRRRATTSAAARPSIFTEIKTLLLGREFSDTFALDDLRPGFAEVGKYVRRAAASIRDRAAARWLRIPAVRRRLHRRAAGQFRAARSIAFVCHGNICRSPFAALYMQRHDECGRRIESFGLHADEDRCSPAYAVAAAADCEIRLEPHRARRTTAELLADFDAIVTFDEANYRDLRRLYPEHAAKVLRFALLSDRGDAAIADPYRRPLADFAAVYRRIAEILSPYCSTGHRLEPTGQPG